MATIYALPKLFADVVARFALEGTAIPNHFGWREPGKHPLTSRICWVPGDKGGKSGNVEGPKFPGRNPRPLLTVVELVTLECYGRDLTDPENELAQYEATITVRDALLRAIYLAAHGTFKIVDLSWIKPERLERRHGAALRIVATIENMVADVMQPSLPDADGYAGAQIYVEELGVCEQVLVDPSPIYELLITEGGDFLVTEGGDFLAIRLVPLTSLLTDECGNLIVTEGGDFLAA